MTRTKALARAGAALCAIGCGLGAGLPAPAAVWNPNFSNTKPNEVRRSEKMDERDMVGIITMASAYPDGWMSFVVRPEGAKVPYRLVAYDYMNKEVARVSSADGGAASITVPVSSGMIAMFRMVPIGSRFDPPADVGALYRGEASTAANQIRLPVYSFAPIAVRDATGATAEQLAALAMPGEAGARTASAAPLPPAPERRTILGGMFSVPAGTPAKAASAAPAPALAAAPRIASAVAAPVAAPGSTAPAAPAAAAPVKSWGALAQMAGTVWTNEIQVLSFEWATPNETMLITRKGLYGEIQTVVAGSADGKGLRYVSRDIYTGDQYEGQVAPSNGRVTLRADAAGRMSCKLPKPGQMLACEVQSAVGKTWAASTMSYAVSNPAGAQAVLAALPGVFPGRADGQYDKQLGPFVYMGNARWYDAKTGQQAYVSGGRGASGLSLQVAAPGIVKSFLFNQGADGRLVATLDNSTEKNPEGKQASVLEVLGGGVVRICYQHYGSYCDVWRLSSDGRKIMQETGGARYVFEHVPLPQRDPAKEGLLGTLDERLFRNASGQTLEYKNYAAPGTPRYMSIMRYRNSGYLASSCSTDKPGSLHCTFMSQRLEDRNREYDFKLTEAADSFGYDGTVYTIAANGDLVATSGGGSKEIFKPSSAGELAYIRQAYDDSESVRGSYVSRQMAQESRDAVWRGIAQGIADMPNTMRQWQRDNAFLAPTDWSQRIPAGGAVQRAADGRTIGVSTGGAAGQVGGYAQSMGSTIFVSGAPESPEYRMKREEIERYEIRKRLYGDKDADYGPSVTEKAAAARTAYLRDEIAKREVEEAEEKVRAAEEEARQKETDASSAKDARAAEEARKAAGEARDAARKAQEEAALAKAKADADARADADRKRQEGEALAEKARIEKARAEEAKRKEDEDKRARAQMAAATVSGDIYYGPFGPRREPQSGPGQGNLSKRVFGIAGCYAEGVQVRYNLSGLMGEAVVNGSWSWSSNDKCSLPSNTVVWLKLQSGNAMGYVRLDPAVPAANAGSGYNSASSPPWSELICSFRGSGPTTCLDEKRAREMWGSAIVTGFEIAW